MNNRAHSILTLGLALIVIVLLVDRATLRMENETLAHQVEAQDRDVRWAWKDAAVWQSYATDIESRVSSMLWLSDHPASLLSQHVDLYRESIAESKRAKDWAAHREGRR